MTPEYRQWRRQRQAEGIAKAKAAGIYKGRPVSIDADRIRAMRADGVSPTVIARKLGIHRCTVYRALLALAAAASLTACEPSPPDPRHDRQVECAYGQVKAMAVNPRSFHRVSEYVSDATSDEFAFEATNYFGATVRQTARCTYDARGRLLGVTYR